MLYSSICVSHDHLHPLCGFHFLSYTEPTTGYFALHLAASVDWYLLPSLQSFSTFLPDFLLISSYACFKCVCVCTSIHFYFLLIKNPPKWTSAWFISSVLLRENPCKHWWWISVTLSLAVSLKLTSPQLIRGLPLWVTSGYYFKLLLHLWETASFFQIEVWTFWDLAW